MSKAERIRTLHKQFPTASNADLAERAGVSPQYVYQIIAKSNGKAESPRPAEDDPAEYYTELFAARRFCDEVGGCGKAKQLVAVLEKLRA
jgi:hypothetical protein